MITVRKICMCLFLASLPALYYGTTRSWYEMLSNAGWRPGRIVAFLAGVTLFFPARLLAETFFKRQWYYLKTLEHELTHILVGLLFLKVPVGMRVTAFDGGRADYVGFGATGETWIALAPYFFPTLPFIILLIARLIGVEGLGVILVLGFGTSFHIFTTWEETHATQSDIRKVGLFRAVLILPLMNLLSVGIIFSYVVDSLPTVAMFLAEVGNSVGRFWRIFIPV